jgi:hypothetical protein
VLERLARYLFDPKTARPSLEVGLRLRMLASGV